MVYWGAKIRNTNFKCALLEILHEIHEVAMLRFFHSRYSEDQDFMRVQYENVSLSLGHYIIDSSIFAFCVSDIKIFILCVQEKNGCNTEDNGRSAKC